MRQSIKWDDVSISEDHEVILAAAKKDPRAIRHAGKVQTLRHAASWGIHVELGSWRQMTLLKPVPSWHGDNAKSKFRVPGINVRFKIFAQRFRVVLGKGNPTASMLKFPWGQASWNNRDFVLGMVTKNWRDLRPWIHGRENMIQLAVFFSKKGTMIQWSNAVVNGLYSWGWFRKLLIERAFPGLAGLIFHTVCFWSLMLMDPACLMPLYTAYRFESIDCPVLKIILHRWLKNACFDESQSMFRVRDNHVFVRASVQIN